jgi:hypothetical protein
MKDFKAMAAALASAVALALTLAPIASAECGGLRGPHAAPTGWHPQLLRPSQIQPGRASFLTVSDHDRDDEDIVGFWHVKFVSEGSEGIPDGTEIDAGYSQWHSDGTEIMNSGGRSPITDSFCLGVWEKVGHCRYKLNHFAAAWDATGAHLVGPANIREDVAVDSDHDHFTGTFTIDQYDESGNKLVHVVGKITGSRIKVGTPPSSIF